MLLQAIKKGKAEKSHIIKTLKVALFIDEKSYIVDCG